ncbi:ATP-binding protein [Streptomyces regalis]|uniref:NB-ARC domain-containing protein n=1 Tax=Streptomyces regalis TaxID=68262 RepID=A0A101JGX1_9ACTN|nr:tetratricopeptide repeat protein [Streptomyces regalis]KUL26226.1 hypothetical protein ADL12_32740 [Streptomyces regalis]
MGSGDGRPAEEELVFSAIFRLPPQTSTYVNYTELQRSLRDLVARAGDSPASNTIVSAITGQGGIGKTALAVRVAHSVRDLFPDGQLYVNLRGYDSSRKSPYDVLGDFLRALGVDGAAIPTGLEQRMMLYQSRMENRRILVVLDNARDAAQVRPLLPETPRCPVIVTSRSRMVGLTGTHSCDMELLSPEAAVELLRRVVGAERVDADAAAARRLTELCGGLPLAVRIAAAKLVARPHWTPSNLVARLEDEQRRLRELHAGDLGVRSTFALSYADLLPQAQRLFRLLAVCPPSGFPPWVAGVLLEEDLLDATELLELLVDVHLIEVEDARDPGGLPRYRFHDLLRVYAHELLLSEDGDDDARQALSRILTPYLWLAERGAVLLRAPLAPDPGLAALVPVEARRALEASPLTWFETERGALVALVSAAHDARMDEIAWRLAAGLTKYFDVRARWQDWERTYRLGLASAERAGQDHGRALMTLGLGVAAWYESEWTSADERLREAVELFRTTGDRLGQAHALRRLGVVRRDRSQWEAARSAYEEALSLFRAVGDASSQALTLRNLGDVDRDMSRFDTAHQRFDEALALYTAHPDPVAHAYLDRSRGDALCAEGRTEEALVCLRAALDVFHQAHDRRAEARTLRNIGLVHLDQRHYGDSEVYFQRSLELFGTLGDRHGEARTRLCLATALRHSGRAVDALRAARSAATVFRELDDRLWTAKSEVEAGDIVLSSEGPAAAETAWRNALVIFREIGAAEAAEVEGRLHNLREA